MKNNNGRIVLIACCVIFICTGYLLAADWPQWRGSDRDGKVSDFSAPANWPTELTQKWKKTVGLGCATPDIVGDKLYVFTRQGAEEVTLCLNAATGDQIWRNAYEAQAVTGAASRHPGPRSTPAVADGKIVTLGVGGVLSCLNAADGQLIWRNDPFPKVVPRFFTAMSPIIVDSMAIAHLGGAGNGAVIAYDLASGNEKWRWDGEGPEYASPALLTVDGTKQIVTLAEKNVVGIAVSDGKLLWQLPFAPQGRAYNAATPIVNGQTVIYTGAGRGTFAVKVEKKADGFTTSPLWGNPDIGVQYNTPVLKDGFLYGLTNRGNLFCINATDGKTAWLDETGRDRSGFGTIVDAGSCLLALTSGSEMVVYKPDSNQYSEIAKIKVAETPTYAQPVAFGSRIFIKDQDSVALLTVD